MVWLKCHHHRGRGDGKLPLSDGCYLGLGSGGEILILGRVHLGCISAVLLLVQRAIRKVRRSNSKVEQSVRGVSSCYQIDSPALGDSDGDTH